MDEGKELRHLRRESAGLADLGLRAAAGTDLDELLTDAAREVARSLDVRFVKVLEYLPDEGSFLIRAGVGWEEGVVGRARIEADGGSPAGLALRTGEPVISVDLDREDRFRIPPILRAHGVRSMVNVIIKRKDEVFGVLEADSREQRGFTEDDATFLEGYATILSLAIEQAWLVRLNAELAARQETLLRELQHRVRNNNQQLSSLVQLQIHETASSEAREALQKVAWRIMALSRAHEQLKTGSDAEAVELGHYLLAVARSLFDFHTEQADKVEFTSRLTQVGVSIQQAQALGLILNEFLTNSFKYAFKQGAGHFVLELSQDHESATLRLCDDGPGFVQQPTQGLGLKLIEALTRQIDGVATWERSGGVDLQIVFPLRATPA